MSEASEDSLSFRADQWAAVLIVVGALMLVFLLVVLPEVNGPFAIAVTFLVLGIWKCSSYYVRLNSDYFETKLAPAAGWHNVLYSEVVSVELEPDIMMIYFRRHDAPQDSEPKRIKLRLGEIQESERERLISAFQAKLPKIEIISNRAE